MSQDERPTEEAIAKAEVEITQVYLTALLQILFARGHGELNYTKQAIETPQGGKYLLQLVHVDGPKIDCQKLQELA